MAQSHVVTAARKRMKKRGYMDISILKRIDRETGRECYIVTAAEPLASVVVSRKMWLDDLYDLFKGY